MELIAHVKQFKDDYYSLFQVDKKASNEEINRAYKKLALRLHPDKNNHPDAEALFKHVGNAKKVLTDTRQRYIYDSEGATGLEAGKEPIDIAQLLRHAIDFAFSFTMYKEYREAYHEAEAKPDEQQTFLDKINKKGKSGFLLHLVPFVTVLLVLMIAAATAPQTHQFSSKANESLGLVTPFVVATERGSLTVFGTEDTAKAAASDPKLQTAIAKARAERDEKDSKRSLSVAAAVKQRALWNKKTQ
ncbi:Chaperone protein DnaJ [Diplonema papillatum]|nr:Chaperone protein DnaJ [Diplonema papillatum]KAJ9437684.1 Chaperone protein DnaJ [Diplonema papillatum]